MAHNDNGPQGNGSSALPRLVAYIFATVFTFFGLLLASHQFFDFPFLDKIIRIADDARGDAAIGSQVAMFGMLIFGIGFALLLTQFFAESYSVKWKGITFTGTLAAILIFMWIVQSVLVEPYLDDQKLRIIDDQRNQIKELKSTKTTLSEDLADARNQVSTLRVNYQRPKDLSLNINCERSAQSQSLDAGRRVQLLAISSRPSPSGRARIAEIVKLVREIEEDLPDREKTFVSDELRETRFQQVEDADILFVPKTQGGEISYFVPGLLSVLGQDVQIRLINADPADGSVPILNPAYSDLLRLSIKNPGDLSIERQVVVAELQFAALAELCNVGGNTGEL